MTTQHHQAAPTSPHGMMLSNLPKYEAFGQNGPYLRQARTIGELPHSLRKPAMEIARNHLGAQIKFGTEIGPANGMTRREIEADSRAWLQLKGCDLPLTLFLKQH